MALFFCCGIQLLCAGAFEDANAAFKAGDYQKAADGYEKVLKTDGHSAAVYYNLGNTYQKLEQYGSAILAYERAKLITPRDHDLRANLQRARKEVSTFESEEEKSILKYFSRNEWSWILVGGAFAGAGIVFLAGCKRLEKRWMRSMAVGGICASVLVIGIAGTVLIMRSDEGNRAVVVSKDAVVRLSPFESAETVGTPGAGRTVKVGKRAGGFSYVSVPEMDMSGWMAEDDLGRVIP